MQFVEWTSNQASYILDVEKKLEELGLKKIELDCIYEDVKTRVQSEERRLLVPRKQVTDWLRRVEVTQEAVEDLIRKGDEEKAKKCYTRGFRSSYKLGKLATNKLKILNSLIQQGDFDQVADDIVDSLAYSRPIEPVVGFESMFDRIWKSIQDDDCGEARNVGLYGMGGVGKTTLLKQVNNEFLQTCRHKYDVIAWVVVSKQVKIENIQKVIWNKLMIPEAEWDNTFSTEDRAARLHDRLKTKKFLLFLDDIWERVDLSVIGVPNLTSSCKILFTTRSRRVCSLMGAQKSIKVECLSKDKALELFQDKVGKETLDAHPEILELSKVVAEECKGLPLALVTVGRAMASRRSLQEWKHAIEVLKNHSSSFESIEHEVFSLLEFSYEHLVDDTHKKCFLYCSIFPEDFSIDKGHLIDLWVGEGLLDEYEEDVCKARHYGEHIIGSLTLACLLEINESDEDPEFYKSGASIKMHDVVRDMAIWITSAHGLEKNKNIVLEDARVLKNRHMIKYNNWENAERISLWGWDRTVSMLKTVNFSSLHTLIMRNSNMTELPDGVFKNMIGLRVLDLSSNRYLPMLPADVGELLNLQYLNIMATKVTELPMELKKLVKLRFLLLGSCCFSVPGELLSKLSSLTVFRRFYGFCSTAYVPSGESEMIAALTTLEDITEISLLLEDYKCIETVFHSPKLQSCVRFLALRSCSLIRIEMSPAKMELLESIDIFCPVLEEISIHPAPSIIKSSVLGFSCLRRVEIGNCRALNDLSLLVCHAPNIQYLRVWSCWSMVEIVATSKNNNNYLDEIFKCLVELSLEHLPQLKRIITKKKKN